MNVQYGLGISFIPTDGLETRTLFLSCRLLNLEVLLYSIAIVNETSLCAYVDFLENLISF